MLHRKAHSRHLLLKHSMLFFASRRCCFNLLLGIACRIVVCVQPGVANVYCSVTQHSRNGATFYLENFPAMTGKEYRLQHFIALLAASCHHLAVCCPMMSHEEVHIPKCLWRERPFACWLKFRAFCGSCAHSNHSRTSCVCSAVLSLDQVWHKLCLDCMSQEEVNSGLSQSKAARGPHDITRTT